jgi:FtsH-binding integral membrane protein
MKLLVTVLSISLLVGCTITKRHFGPGYHVEWKKSVSKIENEVDRLTMTDSGRESSMVPDENEVIFEETISTDTMRRTELISPDQLEISIEEPADFSKTPAKSEIKPLIVSDQISDEEVPVEVPKRRVELFTWISLGSLILAVIFAILSLTLAGEIPWIFAAVHYFGFVIFSMISVVQVRKKPSKYKGKGLTWTLFGLGLATIVSTIVLTIYKVVEFFT